MFYEATENRGGDARQRIVITQYPTHRVGSLMNEEVELGVFETAAASCFAIIDKLVHKGELTVGRASECRAYLDLHVKRWPQETVLEDNAILYLDGTSVSYLQHLKLLQSLAKIGLTTFISAQTVEEYDSLISYEAHSSSAAALIESLRIKLRKAIDTGVVRLGKMTRSQSDDPTSGLRAHPSISVLDTASLVDAIVVDDRYINQTQGINLDETSCPTLTSVDLFDIFAREKIISQQRNWELRTILRRAGIVFIPVRADELGQFLSESSIQGNQIIESAELKAIRECVFRISMSDALQLPHEGAWLEGLFHVCYVTLKDIWSKGGDENEMRAKADWLIDLWDARRWAHRLHLIGQSGQSRYRAQLAAIIAMPISIDSGRRPMFWAWIDQCLIEPLQSADIDTYDWLINQTAMMVQMSVDSLQKAEGAHD